MAMLDRFSDSARGGSGVHGPAHPLPDDEEFPLFLPHHLPAAAAAEPLAAAEPAVRAAPPGVAAEPAVRAAPPGVETVHREVEVTHKAVAPPEHAPEAPAADVWTIRAQLRDGRDPLPSCWLPPTARVIDLRRSLAERGARDRVGGYGLAIDFGTALTNRRIWDEEYIQNAGLYHGCLVAVYALPLRVVVTASADGTARIWSGLTGELMQTLMAGGGTEKPSPVDDLASASVSEASPSHASSYTQQSSQEEIGRSPFPGYAGRGYGTDSDSQVSRTGSAYSTARGRPAICASVNVCAFSPDGTKILTASDDQTAKIFEVDTGECLVVLVGHEQLVRSATFSPDGIYVLTASDDDTAIIWEAFSGNLVRRLESHGHFVRTARFSPDGLSILTASFDHDARLWETESGRCTQTLSAHGHFVRSASWGPDGSLIATASSDHTANIWDASTGEVLRTCRGHTGTVYSAIFSSTGVLLVTASFDGSARVWSVDDGECIHTLRGHRGVVRYADFSPIADMIVTVSFDHTAKIWDVEGGNCIQTLTGHGGDVVFAAWSQDSDEVVTTSFDGTAKVWRAKFGVCKLTLTGHSKNVVCAQFNSS